MLLPSNEQATRPNSTILISFVTHMCTEFIWNSFDATTKPKSMCTVRVKIVCLAFCIFGKGMKDVWL